MIYAVDIYGKAEREFTTLAAAQSWSEERAAGYYARRVDYYIEVLYNRGSISYFSDSDGKPIKHICTYI